MIDMNKEDMEIDEMFHGEEKPLHPDTAYETFTKPTGGAEKKVTANTTRTEKDAQKPAQKPTKANEAVKDAQCEPVKPAPDSMEKLKHMAKDVFKYAALSLILFWWQQTGRLEETTAWYSLLVCVGMVFFSVGKNWRWGESK